MEPIDYDVLNAVCLKKMATPAVAAAATGHDPSDVSDVAQRLAAEGLLVDLGGTFLPSDAAVPALEQEAASRYAAAREDAQVHAAADKFEPVNSGFLEAMSAWQLVKVGDRKVPNDHTDPDYDDKVVSRIERLVARLAPVLAAFSAHDGRFAAYTTRFEAALDEVARGRTEFVSLPTVDSVHNVWFELHEDLLRTLGRQRVE